MGAAACQTVTSVVKLGVNPAKLGELLRAYVDTIPESVIRLIGAREDLVGSEGRLKPLGPCLELGAFVLVPLPGLAPGVPYAMWPASYPARRQVSG